MARRQDVGEKGSLEARPGEEPGRHESSATASSSMDATLVEAVRSGQIDAFSALYRAHAPAVRLVVSERVRDPEQATDVIQEAFARALEALPSLKDPGHFRPWLLSIARHVAVDTLRSRSRTVPLEEAAADDTPSTDPEPPDVAEMAELAELVQGCIGGLSRRDATALTMIRLGFSLGDVAAALGITHGATKVLVHRARRRLRDALVLRTLVRTQGATCEVLQQLLDGRDSKTSALTRHIRTCDLCSGPRDPERPW